MASAAVVIEAFLGATSAAMTAFFSAKRSLPPVLWLLLPPLLLLTATGAATTTTTTTTTIQSSQQSRPNFVIVLADDLDWTLGGASASTLTKTRRLLGGNGGGKDESNESNESNGITLPNWFVQTPVCCASRAELLTGRLYHNLRVASSDQPGCMHVAVADDPSHYFWDKLYFSNYFGAAASQTNNRTTVTTTTTARPTKPSLDLNYKVGIFGKHLNTHNPTSFVPNGVDEMLINGGGEYLDPSFVHGTRSRRNGKGGDEIEDDVVVIEKVAFDNCTETTGMPCYSTSVIGNASLAWIKRQVAGDGDKNESEKRASERSPFLALVSVKAPHIQDGNGFPMAIPAPWYQNTTISEQLAPRTPNYNNTGDGHHHWLVRTQPPLTKPEASMVDDLYVSRLKTLLSVDDLVEDLVRELERLNVLDNTYVIFTSDNGYRLGQFRMPQCKLHPYENDVRVPMMIRGPGIGGETQKPRAPRDNPAPPSAAVFSHVHLMPTLLGLATGKHDSQDILPDTMDGTNLAGWLLSESSSNEEEEEEPKGSLGRQATTPTTSSASSVSLLIEYTSLGNVVRYQHLIDTYNHSFVALRIMPRDDDPTTRKRTAHWSSGKGNLRSNGTTTTTTTIDIDIDIDINIDIDTLSNLKYIEFRDSRVDWTNNKTPPLERELYDLDRDPYELTNLLAGHDGDGDSDDDDENTRFGVSPSLLRALEAKTKRLIACSGDDCRREHSTGLDREEPEAVSVRED